MDFNHLFYCECGEWKVLGFVCKVSSWCLYLTLVFVGFICLLFVVVSFIVGCVLSMHNTWHARTAMSLSIFF